MLVRSRGMLDRQGWIRPYVGSVEAYFSVFQSISDPWPVGAFSPSIFRSGFSRLTKPIIIRLFLSPSFVLKMN